jgi:methyl-accepting chemotaxis protein
MSAVRDWSLRVKLLAGFGSVLAVTIILGVVMLVQIGSVNDGGVFIAGNTVPALESLDQIAKGEALYRADQLSNIMDSNPATSQSIVNELSQDAKSIAAGFSAYYPTIASATDRAFWNKSHSAWQSYLASTALLSDAKSTVAQKSVDTLANGTSQSFRSLQNTINQWISLNNGFAQTKKNSNSSTYNSAVLIGIILLLLAVLIGIAVALLVSGSIKKTVSVVLNRIESLQERDISYVGSGLEAFADGDLTHRYESNTEPIDNPSRDELGQVGTAINNIREKLAGALHSYNRTADKLGQLVNEIAESATNVSSSSQEMSATSEQVGTATTEIATAITEIATGSMRQAQVAENARSAADDVSAAVNDSAQNASLTAEVANQAREVARQGVEAAGQAEDAMRAVRDSSVEVSGAIRELSAKSEQIGAIVQTITGIAQQTNLLALNAAIEAARAGEQGRGFAVVAEEVRKLAEESQSAARSISELIATVQGETEHAVQIVEAGTKSTEEGVIVVEQTREAFGRIDVSVEEMTSRIEQIAAAAQQISASAESMQQHIGEVAAVAEQSSASTEQVSASTQQNSASTQEIAASARELADNAETLNRLVLQFKVTA